MYKITIHIDCPGEDILGAKEDLATYCERYGDIKHINVEVDYHQTAINRKQAAARRY